MIEKSSSKFGKFPRFPSPRQTGVADQIAPNVACPRAHSRSRTRRWGRPGWNLGLGPLNKNKTRDLPGKVMINMDKHG